MLNRAYILFLVLVLLRIVVDTDFRVGDDPINKRRFVNGNVECPLFSVTNHLPCIILELDSMLALQWP